MGMAPEDLDRALDVAPDETDGRALISYNGEGMKLAAISLTQEDGFVMFFSKQETFWTVVALDKTEPGDYVQHSSLTFHKDLFNTASEVFLERGLSSWYEAQGFPAPHRTIKKLCRLPTTRSGDTLAGHALSPYDGIPDLQQVSARKHLYALLHLRLHLTPVRHCRCFRKCKAGPASGWSSTDLQRQM